ELTAEERELLQGDSTMSLTATASFPEDLAGELTVLVNYQTEEGDEQYLGGARYADGDILPVDQHGRATSSGAQDVVGGTTPSVHAGSEFTLEPSGERMTMFLEANFEALGGRFEANLLYVSGADSVHREDYVMELAR
ncbi:hypothetical protein QC820_16690, partial [Halomonas mongoliensis]